MENKNILIISEAFIKGGSGKATQNIFEFINSIYPNTKLLIPFNKTKIKNIISYYNSLEFLYYLLFKLLNRILCKIISTNNFYFFNKALDYPLFNLEKIEKKISSFKPDYLLVLWYEYILDYNLINKIKNKYNLKVVIYPFDMFGFTGGCRYSQACRNYLNQCKNCSALKKNYSRLAENNFTKNKNLLDKIQPKFIFPSGFAKEFANDTKISSLTNLSEIIHYPIIFEEKNNSQSINDIKKKYNIKKDEKIIFFGAQDLREWRKGVKNFQNVISLLNDVYLKKDNIKVKFICVGKNSKKIFKNFLDKIISYESVPHNELVNIYRISDLIIIPSLQEWSSLMMSEVIFLKKTVFAFKTGSSNDLIIENINGLIFDNFEYDKIAKNIIFFLKNNKLVEKNEKNKNLNIEDKIQPNVLKDKFIKKVFND